MIEVLNLATGRKVFYSGITPHQAVVAAHAQESIRDFSTWDYQGKYESMVREGDRVVTCGDWTTMK